jgi:DNA modification methylase
MISQIISINKLKNNTGQIMGLPKNPRLLKDDKFKKLVKSIKDDPEMLQLREVIAYELNSELIVIAGNMRLGACKELGLKEIPVKILPQDTSVEKLKAYTIKDNLGYGEWSWDDIANEWDMEQLEGWGMDLPVFDYKEIEAEEDDFDVPDGGIETDIVIGDLFEIGEHRLLCGDSTDSDQVAKLMNGKKADMVFTDPPYGMKLDADYSGMKSEIFKGGIGGKKYDNVKGDHEDFTEELINTIFACFNDCKEIFIWGADYFAELLPNKNDGSWVVWDKRANGNDDITEDKSSDKMYGSTFELCWSKNKHKRDIARVKWAGIFGMPSQDTKGRVHPTQKPIELANWFFNKWGKDNDLIADLYLGGGTTMVASHQLNRKCYGMELDPKYCQVIVNRMIKLDPTLSIKRNGIDETQKWLDEQV